MITSPRTARRLHRLVSSLPLALALYAPLSAQSLNWSSAGTSALGGAGAWNASGLNWWNGSSAVAWPASGQTNQALFGGTAGTVTLDTALSANALGFSSTGYTLSGGQTLTLNGAAPLISVTGPTASATIGNNTALVLAGTAGLTKVGTGALNLNGSAPHTFTGGLQLNAGSLNLTLANLATPTNFVPASNTLTGAGGTLTLTGKTGAAASQTFAGTVLNRGNTNLRAGNPTGATAATTTLNTGPITRNGPGAVVRFNTPNATSFGTAISGTDRVFVGGTTNGTWLGPWAFTGDHGTTTIRFAYADTTNGQIRQQGGVGATANTMANVTNPAFVYTAQNANTLTNNIVALGLQTVNSATYNMGDFTATFGGFISITAGNTANFTSTGSGRIQIAAGNEMFTTGPGTTNFNVPVGDNPGNASHLTHIGTGVLNLGALNTYTGQTHVIGGTLTVTETGNINSSSGVFVSGGTFRQNNFLDPLTVPVMLQGGRMEGYGNAGTVTATHSTDNVIANLSNTPAPLTINTLVFQGSGTLAPSVGPSNQPYLVENLTTTPAVGQVIVAPVSPPGGWADGTNTYNLLTYTNWSGSLSDFAIGTASPAFAARQSGTLSLDGNTLKLTVAGDRALWTGAAGTSWTTSAVGAPFNWRTLVGGVGTEFIANDEVVFDDTAVNPNVVISTANVTVANLFVNNTTQNYSITAAPGFGISAVGNFIKTGAGRLTLGGTNTYSSTTTVSEGTLAVGSPTAFQGNGSLLLGSNVATPTNTATLDLNGHSARLVSLTSGTATTQTITNTGTGTGTDTLTVVAPTAAISALITDGPTRKTGVGIGFNNGNLTNPNNTFSGGLLLFGTVGGGVGTRLSPIAANNPTVVDGVLTNGTFGTGPITIGINATERAQFYFNAPSVVLANPLVVNTALGTDSTFGALRVEDHSIVVSGPVVANLASVVVHHNGQFSGGPTAGGPSDSVGVISGQVTFTGPISTGENPAAGFTAQQTNVTTTKRLIVNLANTTATPNSYTGNTTLTAPNVWLQLGADEQIPHGPGRGNVISTGSTIDLNGFSETINGLSGSGFIENVAGLSPVTLTLGAGDATGLTYSGIIFDARGGSPVSLTKVGTGTQILSGSQQYTGATTVSEGTLQIGAGGTTGSLLPVSPIVTNGTIAFSRSNPLTQGTDFAAGISGTGGLRQAGSGDLVLNTANTYAGPTAIASGTLSLTGEGTIGAGQVSLAAGSTFDVSAANPATLSLTGGLAGSGTVNALGKTLSVGGAFAPVALSITGNVALTNPATTVLLAGDSPATTSLATATGSVVNRGALSITAGPGVTFAAGQSYTFFTAGSGITAGFTSVNVGGNALNAQTPGTWSGTANGLTYTYAETTATLTVAAGGPALTSLETWRQDNFGSSNNSGNGANLADPDQDGISNLMEYALGGNPLVANASINPVVSGRNPLSLTFNRIGDSSLTYTVEATNELGTTWSQIFTSSGTAGQITVQDPGPVTGNRRFLRLVVTLAE